MTAPSVSVIVVSRGRAADLPLCLLGISQLDYPNFEVVLVVDPQGHAAAHRTDLYDKLKVVPFDEANISKARNLGIAEAAGEIIAFIDDDAVPEPTWLTHLVAGFADPEVACAGGFVRGRNGISFQWMARTVDTAGVAWPLDLDETGVAVLTPSADRAIKTEGTNMAVRRDVLAELGGFDKAYCFYLDETDLNMRLAQVGHKTAIAPLAQVHHGYKASATRRSDRTPQDLYEIGASQAVFLRKFTDADQRDAILSRFRSEQRQRLLGHMVAGRLEPRDVRRLLKRLNSGIKEGLARDIHRLAPIGHARYGFKQFAHWTGGTEVFSARTWKKRSVTRLAKDAVAAGQRASVFVFSLTMRPHKLRFTRAGFWLQTGGVFGRSLRSGPRFRLTTFRKRLAQEVNRVSQVRKVFPK